MNDQVEVKGIPPFTLSCTGLPTGSTCSFSGSQVADSTWNYTITVPSGLVAGTYPFQIMASSDGETTSVSRILQVINFSVARTIGKHQLGHPRQQWPGSSYNNTRELWLHRQHLCDLHLRHTSGTCIGGIAYLISQTPQSVQSPFPNSNRHLSQRLHQIQVTATVGSITQTYSFPFTVADFSGSLSTSSITLARGANTSLTATLSATTGFVDTVSLSCGNVTLCNLFLQSHFDSTDSRHLAIGEHDANGQHGGFHTSNHRPIPRQDTDRSGGSAPIGYRYEVTPPQAVFALYLHRGIVSANVHHLVQLGNQRQWKWKQQRRIESIYCDGDLLHLRPARHGRLG